MLLNKNLKSISLHLFFFLCIITSSLKIQPMLQSQEQKEHLKQILQLPKIITASNVNTRLKDIPKNTIKGYDHYYPLEYAASYPLEFFASLKPGAKWRKVIISDNFEEIIDHLLTAGADPNQYTYARPIASLAALNRCHLVKKLIDHGAIVPPDIFTHTGFSVSCLSYEIDLKIIDLLVEHGADVNAQDASYKQTSLFYTYNPAIIRCLLNHGANPTIKTMSGTKAAEENKKLLTYNTPLRIRYPIFRILTRNILEENIKHLTDCEKSIIKISNALKDERLCTTANLDRYVQHDITSLRNAYKLFQQGNHEPLREMLIVTPWLFCRLTENKDSKKDPKWAKQGKLIRCNTFALTAMVIACQHVFKPETIRPLIRYLALAQTDGNTMCEYKRIMLMYDEALSDQSLNVALEKPKTKKSSCCSIS